MNASRDANEQLVETAEEGDLDTVQRLVEGGADVTHDHYPPIMRACSNGHLDIVEYLLTQGFDINYDQFGEGTMLNLSAFHDEVDKIVFLIDRGADINRRMPRGGEGPLHNAADQDRLAAAKLLTERGADVDKRAGNGPSDLAFGEFAGETPLHVAAANSGAELIQALLDAGANKAMRNTHGKTPLDYATEIENAPPRSPNCLRCSRRANGGLPRTRSSGLLGSRGRRLRKGLPALEHTPIRYCEPTRRATGQV